MVGDRKSDKVTLLIRYTTGGYHLEYKPRVFDPYAVTVMLNGEPYTLGLFDTPSYDEIARHLYYPQTDVFLVCFSLVHPLSLEGVREKWAPELKHHCPKTPIVLVGTKLEKRDDEAKIEKLRRLGLKPVTYVEGLQLQKEIGAVKYRECSAKTQEGVTEVFMDAIRAVVMSFYPGNTSPIFIYDPQHACVARVTVLGLHVCLYSLA